MLKKSVWTNFTKYMDKITEMAYLTMFLIQTAFRFFMTTEFPVDKLMAFEEGTVEHMLVSLFLTQPQWILIGVILLRYIFSIDYEWKKYMSALAIGFCTFMVYLKNGETDILVYVLLILGAKGISFRKIIRLYFSICVSILLFTMVSSQVGLVENHVWDLPYRNIRIAFGFIYPTDFASHILFLCFCWWYLRGMTLSYLEAWVIVCLGAFVYIFCEARFSAAMLLVLGAIMMHYCYKKRQCKKYRMPLSLTKVLEIIPLLCAVCIHVCSILYNSSNRLFAWANDLLSGRLLLAKRAIDIYGFNLWGAYIPMIGNGGKSSVPEKYFYIDSSYIRFSLCYGLVFLGLFLILFWMAENCIKQKKEWVLMWILALAAVHGLFEQHLFELEFFPFLLVIFSDLEKRKPIPKIGVPRV